MYDCMFIFLYCNATFITVPDIYTLQKIVETLVLAFYGNNFIGRCCSSNDFVFYSFLM